MSSCNFQSMDLRRLDDIYLPSNLYCAFAQENLFNPMNKTIFNFHTLKLKSRLS